MMKTDIRLNTILYGPPGTGKTYNTVNYAVAICEGKTFKGVEVEDYSDVVKRFNDFKKKGRIAFITFHQSYGYEEFIEGIKPLTDKSGKISYEVKEGVFRDFCKNAETLLRTSDQSVFDDIWEKLAVAAKENGGKYTFKRRTGSTIKAKYIETDRFRVEWKGNNNTHNDLTKSAIMNQWIHTDSNRDQLTGGTRWLFDARQAVLDEMKEYGLPTFQTEDACVFIIDEINRGNISKIFGELITLIEEEKRKGSEEELTAVLPYSKTEFSVPRNVYILGTMNTADRSISIMDTAIRRRFDFVEMQPDPDVLSGIKIVAHGIELDVAEMLKTINSRIEVLYDRDHTIGHAFFVPLRQDNSIDALGSVFREKVIPLLQEYFYEDYGKIQMVLGDNDKSDNKFKFIVEERIDGSVFKGKVDISDFPPRYWINEEAFNSIESYQQIIG